MLAEKKGVVEKLNSFEERGKYSKAKSIYVQMLMGDGMQRLAHYFANELEARLDGSRSQICKAVITKPSTTHFLKVYHLLLAVCPFLKVLNFFSNKTIAKAVEKAKRLHIIDFGVLYSFSWPSLIQRLSTRPGGPPKLRITGIDFP